MSKQVQLEAQDAAAGTSAGSDVAAAARTTLSEAASELSRGAGSRAGNEIANSINVQEGAGVAGKINKIEGLEEGLGKKIIGGGIAIGIKHEVTDEDRAEAKEKLASGDLMGLVPKEDQEKLNTLAGALIDGDVAKLGETLKGMSPEEVKKFVDVLNKHMNSNESFGGIELSQDAAGNVLVYGEKGGSALSIDPKTGEATVRAIEHQPDGSILLKPGEVVGKTAADVAKNLGDQMTRSLGDFPILRKPNPMMPPRNPWIDKVPGHPGIKPLFDGMQNMEQKD